MTMDIPSASADLARFHHVIRMISIDPTKNRRRFYELRTQHDLFGDPIVTRTYGRIGTPGRTRISWHTNPDEARTELVSTIALRLRHGYHVELCD